MGLRQSSYVPSCTPSSEDQKAATLDMLFKNIDLHERAYVDRLRKAISFQSVSSNKAHRKDLIQAMHWLKEQMGAVGISCEAVATGMQELLSGEKIDLPPIVLGQLGTSPRKKTLLVYGHLDVQPAERKDGWKTEPFKLAEKEGQLYGRGVADNKAAVISWINAVEMLQRQNVDIPVNIKFCIEGMAHCGSLGIEWLLRKRSEMWLQDVDFVCITDGQWLGNRKPCLAYGSRGVCQFRIEVSTEGRDVHSGAYGGALYEPMADLCWVLDHLTDVTGKITIPGIDKLIATPNEEERKLFESLDFDIEEYRKATGASDLTGSSKVQLLTRIWRCPSLSVHGVEGGYNGSGMKTIIPSKVAASFSIYLVPNMIPDRVNSHVINFLNIFWPKRQSPNSINGLGHGNPFCSKAPPWEPFAPLKWREGERDVYVSSNFPLPPHDR
ncbi:Cytosolic non-specific dipeptidase [Toxocara canis]|uniref:Cytosolic non-specific dipeptidase n=1 Tax=Toxocara canis TaxID=6265 RepID=A0A0B2VTQ3_TOXCA|nr:Cytosolic non-specific dipeptidase [Toxocara canis]